MSMKLKTASGSITLAPEDGSGDVSVSIPRAGLIPTKSTIDALGIAATSVTGSQASAITANTAKTGITSGQASAISANTAKVTNSTDASDLSSGTLADARFPATLPAISGANLTNLPAGGATGIDGLTDGYNVGNSVGLGTDALANDDGTANNNTAVGTNALKSNTTGKWNTASGYNALTANVGAEGNTALGYQAALSNVSGEKNVAVGYHALLDNTNGNRNTAAGHLALQNNTTGNSNAAFGDTALYSHTTGQHNIGIGKEAGSAITTGSNNTVIGKVHGTATMADTVLIGAGATERLKVTSAGLFINGSATVLAGGASDIDGLTDGYNVGNSVGLGAGALAADDGTSNNNTAVGANALNVVTTGTKNVATGMYALYSNTDSKNVATGFEALKSNTSGGSNTASGYQALKATTTADKNTANGAYALVSNTTGAFNIGLGYGAGTLITTGSNNTVIGDLEGTAAMAGTVLIGAGSTERLKVDSTGLYVNGVAVSSGANITSNATAPSSPAVGDQWYDTANGVLYVRVTDGTDAAWLDISSANGTAAAAAAGGGGAWEVVSSQTVTTAVSSVDFTGMSGYENYRVLFTGITLSTSGNWVQVWPRQGGAFQTNGADGRRETSPASSGTSAPSIWSTSSFFQVIPQGHTTLPANGQLIIPRPHETANHHWRAEGVYNYNGSYYYQVKGGFSTGSSTDYKRPIDGVQFSASSGTITGGTFTLYGIKNS